MPVQRLYRSLTLFLLLLVMLATACKKDPVNPPPDTSPDEPETSIRFIAKKDSNFLQGVFVGITPNETDRNNGVYLRSSTTNSSGRTEFKNLLGITYYYSMSYAAPGGAIVRRGSVTLEEGDEVDRTISF